MTQYEEFDAWWASVERDTDWYPLELAWQAWQAATTAKLEHAVEQAAKNADEVVALREQIRARRSARKATP